VLVDTSVAVPALLGDHEHHAASLAAIAGHEVGLAGHAWFETLSVLTRLPPPSRLSSERAHQLLSANFPESRFLSEDAHLRLGDVLARSDIGGGAVYDALIGWTAVVTGLPLVSRDRRALPTYRALDVEVVVVG
jgi:predicted nucleic acid-binding protein